MSAVKHTAPHVSMILDPNASLATLSCVTGNARALPNFLAIVAANRRARDVHLPAALEARTNPGARNSSAKTVRRRKTSSTTNPWSVWVLGAIRA